MRWSFLDSVLRGAEALAARDGVGNLPDPALVRRFAADRDPAAFAVLVRRHGPLIWGVCRNLLSADADAEDAFQATFLALVRSAGTIRRTESLGGWLHGVAYRVALKARRAAARRKRREVAAAVPESDRPVSDAAWDDLQAAVHEEVCKLPARLRLPFVLCGLQGRPQKEAAEALGWTVGAVSSRLTEARRRLLARLARRGVPAGVAFNAVVLGGVTGQAAVPASIVAQVPAMMATPTGVSPTVLSLARGATPMDLMRTKLLAAGLMLAGLLATGFALSRADAQAPDRSAEAVEKALNFLRTQQALHHWEYKFIPVEKPLTTADLQKVLAGADEDGWSYCGAQDLAEGKTGKITSHMVFKRARIGAVTGGEAEAAAALLAEIAERDRAARTETQKALYARELDAARALRKAEQNNKEAADKAAAVERDRLKALEAQALLDKAELDKALVGDAMRVKQLENVRAYYEALIRKLQEDAKGPVGPPATRAEPPTGKTDPRTADQSVTATVKLSHVDGKAAAALLSKVAGTAKVAEVRQDSIQMIGPKAAVTRTREIIEKLIDVSAAGGEPATLVVIPLKYAPASDVANAVQKVLSESKVRVTFDAATNALIVVGPPEAVAEIKGLVVALEARRAPGK
jgi:RNA polymerase sigma factor (sigma-70 family)